MAVDIDAFLAQRYTHLIVGGGTAGLVVAARLSEDPDLCVGVLEAGPAAFDDPRITVPGRFGETLDSEYDWSFQTTRQPGLDGRTLTFNRGKVLGGSSALNFMTWNRGCREDYDAWERLGNKGWGWDGVLPYWKRAETLTEPAPESVKDYHCIHEPQYHGTDGPLQNTYPKEFGASHKHWHATLNKLGVKTNNSHFSGSNVGCWTAITAVTPDKRERSYSATAYYLPASQRKNLFVLTNAIAQEVLLEQEHLEWTAKGVRFMHAGKERIVRTMGEVVVCGGSVSSPQLLELSGIGDPQVLKEAGIECKVRSSKVGENLQEHMMTAMIVELDKAVATPDDLRADPVLAAAADKQFVTEHSGPRTVLPGSVSYLPFSQVIPEAEIQQWAQDLQTSSTPERRLRDQILLERLTTDQNLGQIEYYFDISMYSPHFQVEKGKKYGTMLMMLQYPFSTGSIHIPPCPTGKERTAAEDHPVIDPKYYLGQGGKVDFKAMSLCQRFADKICRTEPLKSIILRRVFPPEKSGGAGAEGEENFEDWVRQTMITDWHPMGTCAMGGHEGIEGGVVDDRLRVYDVKGLRVCDASIMPLQIAAHLQATVYAIGEKGAEMIRQDWATRPQATSVTGVKEAANHVNGTPVNGANSAALNGIAVH